MAIASVIVNSATTTEMASAVAMGFDWSVSGVVTRTATVCPVTKDKRMSVVELVQMA